MNIIDHLRQREWPSKPELEYGKLRGYMLSAFVREGHVETRALQMHQDLAEPPPPGESAITSLCCTPDGLIYGATSGKQSHLFGYYSGPGQDSAGILFPIEQAREVRRSLVSLGDDRVLGGVTVMDETESSGYLFVYTPVREKLGKPSLEKVATPVENEGVAALAVDTRRQSVYGISTVTGTFFVYDITKGEVSVKAPVDEDRSFSRCLVLDKAGNVYGAKSMGELFKYDPSADSLTPLGVRIPSVAGREMYNQLDSAALDENTGLIYGGGSADGVVFVFDPASVQVTALGKITAEPRVRCIAVGLDSRVYGIAGDSDGMGHLFCYDPDTRELADLGIPYSGSERVWHGYEFDAACTGRFGEIYLGESDRISHLFLYLPPIKRPASQESLD